MPPTIFTVPDFGGIAPPIVLKSDVLPAPLRPTRPTLSLARTSKLMPSASSLPPTSTARSRTWITCASVAARGPDSPPGSASTPGGSRSVHLPVAPFPVGLAQLELLELPGGGARQLGAELHRGGALVVGEPFAAVVDELALGGLLTGGEHDERL